MPFSLEWVDPMVAISIKDLFLFDSRNDKDWAGQSLQIDSAMLSYKIVIEQRVVQSSRLVFLYFFQRDNYCGVEKESRHLPSSCVQCNGKGDRSTR